LAQAATLCQVLHTHFWTYSISSCSCDQMRGDAIMPTSAVADSQVPTNEVVEMPVEDQKIVVIVVDHDLDELAARPSGAIPIEMPAFQDRAVSIGAPAETTVVVEVGQTFGEGPMGMNFNPRGTITWIVPGEQAEQNGVQLGWTITTIDGRPFTNAAMTDGQRPKSLGFEEVVVGQHDFCECGVQNAAVALALHAVIALIFVLHTMNTPLSVRDNPLVDDDYEGRHNPYYYEDYDDEGSGVTYMYLWFSRLLYMFMPLLCLVGLVWGIVKRQSVAFKVVLGCDAACSVIAGIYVLVWLSKASAWGRREEPEREAACVGFLFLSLIEMVLLGVAVFFIYRLTQDAESGTELIVIPAPALLGPRYPKDAQNTGLATLTVTHELQPAAVPIVTPAPVLLGPQNKACW